MKERHKLISYRQTHLSRKEKTRKGKRRKLYCTLIWVRSPLKTIAGTLRQQRRRRRRRRWREEGGGRRRTTTTTTTATTGS